MSLSLVSKPVVACSLVASSVVFISYLWFKHRTQEEEDSSSESSSSTPAPLPDLDQVQEKLTSFKRTRLDTLEEEPAPTVPETKSEEAEKEPVQVHFSCEDIRYKPGYKPKTKTKPQPEVSKTEAVPEVVPTSEAQPTNPISTDTTDHITTDQEDITNMAVEETVPIPAPAASVPDVFSALNDPLCSKDGSLGSGSSPGSPHSYSSSPVKSESAQSKSSCEWSDLIEQDEKELREFQLDSRELTCKLSGLEMDTGRSNDSGVASPSEETGEAGDKESGARRSGGKSRTESGEDAGIGSEQGDEAVSDNVEDVQLLAYHFYIPEDLCGKLIGRKGEYIKDLKNELHININLKELPEERKKRRKGKRGYNRRYYYDEPEMKICCIEGTRTNIDKCLTQLKEKFYNNPELTFEQVNRSPASKPVSVNHGSVSLNLAEGVMHDVLVSSIVGGGHVFLQQPCHPTYFALERLDQCMSNTYNQINCPGIPSPVLINSVCAAQCEGGWYRVQIVAHDQETGTCDVKYLDYGGYDNISVDQLKQIRTDFLSLPFQAIECYLANIQPQDDENVSAFILEELVSNQVVQARMIGTNEQGVPMIHLYRAVAGQTTMVNQELVDRNCATWLDTTIVKLESPLDHPSVMWSNLGNFQNRNLGPNAWDKINLIYNVPEVEEEGSSSTNFDANLSYEQPYSDYHVSSAPSAFTLGDFIIN